MDFTVLIEVAIGIMFVWILLALITTQIQEWVAQLLSWKADLLEKSIQGLLGDDDTLKEEFYKHPLIKSLHTNNGSRKPAGIPSGKFALVLFDVFMNAGSKESLFEKAEPTFEKLEKSITGMLDSTDEKKAAVAKSLNTLLMEVSDRVRHSDEGITKARVNVEVWFDDAMDRLRGAYSRRMQVIGIVIGIVLAAVLNADSVMIINKLWKDPVVRQAISDQAQNFELPAQNEGTPATPADVAKYVDQLQGLSIPLGWTTDNLPRTPEDWPSKIIGILISGLAAAQGSPFWFNIMQRLLNKGGPAVGATDATKPLPAPAPVVIEVPTALPAIEARPAAPALESPAVEAAG